ncbi:MAG: cation diffusion facilitator family transporter [Acidimicrobiales bacterium]
MAEQGARPSGDVRRFLVALSLIATFMIGELAAALASGSLVLFADAGHMLTDVGALVLAIFAARLAVRPPVGRWTFGMRRVEILCAAVNGVLLVAIGLVIVVEAINRLLHPPAVNGWVILTVALVGAVVNLAATVVLSGADRTSLNVRGVVAHVVTDLYAFAGTAAAGTIIVLAGWLRADAVCSLAVAALMWRAAWGLLRDSGQILLQGAPEGVDLAIVRSHLIEVPHVVDVHDLHAWTVSSGLPTLSAHVVLEDHCFATGHAPQVLDTLQDCVSGHFDVEHATFQLEPVSHAAHEQATHP